VKATQNLQSESDVNLLGCIGETKNRLGPFSGWHETPAYVLDSLSNAKILGRETQFYQSDSDVEVRPLRLIKGLFKARLFFTPTRNLFFDLCIWIGGIMRKIEPLTIADTDRQRILDNADQIVKDINNFGLRAIGNAEFQEWVLLALVTWKDLAEKRKKVIEKHNEAWVREGYHGMVMEA